MKKQHSARICALALILAALSASVAAKCDEPERMTPAQNHATQAVRECERDTQLAPVQNIRATEYTEQYEDVSILFYADEINAYWAAQEQPETVEEVKEEPAPEIATYWEHIPLSCEVQAFIFAECEKRDINPAVIFAMIKRESTYNPDVIGDQGRAFGLMQIQPRWHEKRIEKLGVTNLLDPVQNVTVGIDYLGELLDMGNGIEWALIYFNAGGKKANQYLIDGIPTDYARIVLNEAERIEANVLHR
jgi:soluble lytic murein transglycosylase-like protein